jgi:shikimate kinase
VIVALVGFMGSGKTTVEKKLASMLDVDFYDTDQLVEQSEKMTVSEIWQHKGEEYFRQLEEKVLFGLLDKDTCVIALGGWLFESHVVREELMRRTFCIWLRRKGLIKRLGERPLISKLPENESMELFKKRSINYAQAHLQIDVDGKTAIEVAREIVERMAEK